MINLEGLIKNKVGALLINKDLEEYLEKYAVIIDASISDDEIMCKYDKKTGEKLLPKWLEMLYNTQNNEYGMLIIKDIDEVDSYKQLRFKEILKNKTINGIALPSNSVILVSYKNTCNSIINVIKNELVKIV